MEVISKGAAMFIIKLIGLNLIILGALIGWQTTHAGQITCSTSREDYVFTLEHGHAKFIYPRQFIGEESQREISSTPTTLVSSKSNSAILYKMQRQNLSLVISIGNLTEMNELYDYLTITNAQGFQLAYSLKCQFTNSQI